VSTIGRKTVDGGAQTVLLFRKTVVVSVTTLVSVVTKVEEQFCHLGNSMLVAYPETEPGAAVGWPERCATQPEMPARMART
jgi:hypothetical protein